MATIWKVDGFGHGVAAAGAAGVYDSLSGPVSIVTSPVRSGARALRIAAANAQARAGYDLPVATRQVVTSIAVRFTTADGFPAASCTLFSFVNANGNGQLRYRQSANRLSLAQATVAVTDVGPPSLALDTWYWVDMIYDSSTATVSLRARVDGGPEEISSRTQTAADCTAISAGTFATDTFICYYDDWVTSLTPADFPLRQHHVETLIPNSDGTHNIVQSGDFDSNAATAFSNATTNANTFIGHRPMQVADIANQVIRQELGSATSYMEFGLENLAASTGIPDGVRAYTDAIEAGTGNQNAEVQLLLANNTEVLTEGSISVLDTAESVATTITSFTRITIPPSGGWDVTKVNGLKMRLGFGDGSPDLNFIDFMIEVSVADLISATPAVIPAVVAVPTPTITLGATPVPDSIDAVVAVPPPTMVADLNVTPTTVQAQAAVPTPTIMAGGAVDAQPGVVAAQASFPTPTITVGSPNPDFYSAGYGQGYETIAVVVPPVVIPPRLVTLTPGLRVQVDWVNDLNLPGPMPEPRWTDITAKLRGTQGAASSRGRKRPLDRNEAGTGTLLFGDVDRDLDPDNVNSLYFPGVSPDRRIRLQATVPDVTEPFTMCSSQVGGTDYVGGGDTVQYITFYDGVTEAFTYDYPGPGKDATVSIKCSDIFALFAKSKSLIQTLGQSVEDTLNLILNQVAYSGRENNALGTSDGSVNRNIDGTNPTPIALAPVVYDSTILDALQETAFSGGGNFFIARDGKPTYLRPDWIDRPGDPDMRFAIEADSERFRDAGFSFDETLIFNEVTVTGGDSLLLAFVEDMASIGRHVRRPISLNTTLVSTTDATTRANDIIHNYAEPTKYILRLDLTNVVTDWALILKAELWDRITLDVLLPNGDHITQYSLIQGIEITTINQRDWSVIWWLSVPPFHNLLSLTDISFEDGTVGGWTAGSNCVLTTATTMHAIHYQHFGGKHNGGVREISTTVLVDAAQGSWVLWADAVSIGDLSILSPVVAVGKRLTYLAQVKVRLARFANDDPTFTAATTSLPNLARNVRLEIDWLDINSAYLSTDIGDTMVENTQNWVQLEIRKRSPNGAAFGRLRIRSLEPGAFKAGQYVDDALFTRIVG